jgi:hypothetical protein
LDLNDSDSAFSQSKAVFDPIDLKGTTSSQCSIAFKVFRFGISPAGISLKPYNNFPIDIQFLILVNTAFYIGEAITDKIPEELRWYPESALN